MFVVKDLLNGLYVSKAREAGMLGTGELLTPISVPGPLGGWRLQGGLQRAMFGLAASEGSWRHSSHLLRTGGFAHLLVCQQIGPWEHRFVVQLLGPTMGRFLREAVGKPLPLVFGCNGFGDWTSCQAPHTWAGKASEQDVRELGADLERPLAALMDAAAMSLGVSGAHGLSRVKDACVTLVMAPEYAQAAERKALA